MNSTKDPKPLIKNENDTIKRVFQVLLHEIRAPLTIINANADMMDWPEIENDKKKELIEGIKKQANKLTDYINELSAIAKGRWKPKIQLSELNASEFDKLLIIPFKKSTQNLGIKMNCKNKYSGSIMLDAEKMSRVLSNLLFNSLEAGGKDTSIELIIHKSAEHMVMEFRDYGPGLPEGREKDLFEPFITFNKSNHIGIGLTICSGIVHEHGGEIYGSNPTGGGALFTIKLPVGGS